MPSHPRDFHPTGRETREFAASHARLCRRLPFRRHQVSPQAVVRDGFARLESDLRLAYMYSQSAALTKLHLETLRLDQDGRVLVARIDDPPYIMTAPNAT